MRTTIAAHRGSMIITLRPDTGLQRFLLEAEWGTKPEPSDDGGTTLGGTLRFRFPGRNVSRQHMSAILTYLIP